MSVVLNGFTNQRKRFDHMNVDSFSPDKLPSLEKNSFHLGKILFKFEILKMRKCMECYFKSYQHLPSITVSPPNKIKEKNHVANIFHKQKIKQSCESIKVTQSATSLYKVYFKEAINIYLSTARRANKFVIIKLNN